MGHSLVKESKISQICPPVLMCVRVIVKTGTHANFAKVSLYLKCSSLPPVLRPSLFFKDQYRNIFPYTFIQQITSEDLLHAGTRMNKKVSVLMEFIVKPPQNPVRINLFLRYSLTTSESY